MHLTELKQIFEEITDLDNEGNDLYMLEALANNAVYVLSKMQKSENINERAISGQVLTDMLHTLNKELIWAKEEEIPLEKKHWFIKAKKQILEDMKALFE
jgi:hypothetical protein